MPGDFEKEMFRLDKMEPDKFIESLKKLQTKINKQKFKPKDLEQNEGNKAEYDKLNGEHIAKQKSEFMKNNRDAMLKEIAVIKQGPAGSDPKSMLEWSEKFPTVLANPDLLDGEGLDLPADQFEMSENWLDFLFGTDDLGIFDFFFGKSNSIPLSDRNRASYNKFVEKSKKLFPAAKKEEPAAPVRSYGGGGGGYGRGGGSANSSAEKKDDEAEKKPEEKQEEANKEEQKPVENQEEVNKEEQKPEENQEEVNKEEQKPEENQEEVNKEEQKSEEKQEEIKQEEKAPDQPAVIQQNQPEEKPGPLDNIFYAYSLHDSFASTYKDKITDGFDPSSVVAVLNDKKLIRALQASGGDQNVKPGDLIQPLFENINKMDEFFKKHEELVKQQYRDVTRSTLEDSQITTDKIENAYPSLLTTPELKALQNPGADLRRDINVVLSATRQALNRRDSSSANYARLSKLDDILTINSMFLNAYGIINEAGRLSKEYTQASSFEESAQLESRLNQMHTEMDASLREKLQFLSQKLDTLGKTFSSDTTEFTDFSTALKNAVNGGSLTELKEAAENYAHLKNPSSQNGKDRLAIANQVSGFLDVVIPLTHEVAQAVNEADLDYYARTHATTRDKLLSPDTPKRIFIEEVSGLMAEASAKKLIAKDYPARKEITQRYARKLQEQLTNSDYETIRGIYDAATRLRGGIDQKVSAGVTALVDNLVHPYDLVKNEIEDQRENSKNAIESFVTFETEESIKGKLANSEVKKNIHSSCCNIMMDKVLSNLFYEDVNYLRVDQNAFMEIYDQISNTFLPGDEAQSLEQYKALMNMPAASILCKIKLPEGIETTIPQEELDAALRASVQPEEKQQDQPEEKQEEVNKEEQKPEEKQEEVNKEEQKPEEKQPEENQPAEKDKQPEEEQKELPAEDKKQPENAENQPAEDNKQEQPAERVEDVTAEIHENAAAARQILPRFRNPRERDRIEENIQEMIDEDRRPELIDACTNIMVEKILGQEDVAYLSAHPKEARAFYEKATERIKGTFFDNSGIMYYANYFMQFPDMSPAEIRSEIGMPPMFVEKKESAPQEQIKWSAPDIQDSDFDFEEEAIDPNTLNETQKAMLEIVESRDITRDEFIKTASDLTAREMIIKSFGKYPNNGDALRDRLSKKIQTTLDNDRNLYSMIDLRSLFMPDATDGMTPAQQLDKGMQNVMGRFMPKEDALDKASQSAKAAREKIRELRAKATSAGAYDKPLTSEQPEWINAHADLMLSKLLNAHRDADYFRLDSDAANEYAEIARAQIIDAYFPYNDFTPQDIEYYTNLPGTEICETIENRDAILNMQHRAKVAEEFLKKAADPSFWKTENGVQVPADPKNEKELRTAVKDYLLNKAVVPAEIPALRANPDLAETFCNDTAELIDKRLLSGKYMSMEEVGSILNFDGDDVRDDISPYEIMRSERYDANTLLHADLLLKKRDERTPKDENEIAALSEEFEANRDKVIEACVNRMAVELIPRDLVIGRETNPADGMPFYRETKQQIKNQFFPADQKLDAEYVGKLVNMSPKEIYQQIDLPESIIKGHTMKTPSDPSEIKLNMLLSPDTSKEEFIKAVSEQVVNKRLVQLYGDRQDPKYSREEDKDLLNKIHGLEESRESNPDELEKLRSELCESPNYARDPISGKPRNLAHFSSIRSAINDNIRKTMMDLPMEQLRECFKSEPGDASSFSERLNNGIIKLTENVSRKTDPTESIRANAEASRKALQQKLDSANIQGKAWNEEMYPAIIDECSNVMLEKILPEKELEYKFAQTGADSYKTFFEETKAQIISSFFPAGAELTPERVQNLMSVKDADTIKRGLSEIKQTAEKGRFMNDSVSMMGLQKRASGIINNPKAPAWEIREAAADYLIFGNFRRNRSKFDQESLYKKTTNLNQTLNPKLYKEARSVLMKSPAFVKLCESPKLLQRAIARKGRDATMNALLAGYDQADRLVNPKKYEELDKKAAAKAQQANPSGNNYAHLAESARQAVEAGERSLNNMRVEDSFKKAIQELFPAKAGAPDKSSMALNPREEMLFKLVQNYVPDGAKMANTTRQWISTALYQKKNNIDNSEMLKKITDGMRYINYKGLQYLEQHAAQCNKTVRDECTCGPEEFIKNWEKTNVIVATYRTVFGDGKQPVSNPECEKNIKSILSMQDTLKKRIDYLTPSIKQEKVKKADSQPSLG